jgi:hypothetical protein
LIKPRELATRVIETGEDPEEIIRQPGVETF